MNLLTRRFPTILGILLLIALVGGGWWYLKLSAPTVSSDITPEKVRVTNVADNKFTVSWITPNATQGYVEYGSVGTTLGSIKYDDRSNNEQAYATQIHHITIVDLQPETQYVFRIVSGPGKTRFDNNGSPYSVATGPTITTTPVSRSIYGEIDTNGQASTGAIVYLTLPGSQPVSTLVTSTNNYSFTISTIRTSDLARYIEYDTTASVASLTIESPTETTTVTVSLANAEPVPKISLGQNADYRSEMPPVAQVEPVQSAIPSASVVPSESPMVATPGIFNVEPLNNSENAQKVMLVNPSQEGEALATTKPEFQGTGPASTTLSISVHSTNPQSSSVVVASDGTWKWTPPKDLAPGAHTITINYIDAFGIEQTLNRTFIVSPALAAEGDPAFVSTPSGITASPKASPSPSSSSLFEDEEEITVTPSPREVIPSTESGVPVTGILTPTLLTGLLGFVIMLTGAVMLAL